jgi:predicted porin
MKKTLIALAALAATSAFAQSTVTLFGVADIGYGTHTTTGNVVTGGAAASIKTAGVMDGANAGSRIGFRGTEDLGGGLKADFWVEQGISPTNGALFGVRSGATGHQVDGFSAAGAAGALSGTAGAYSQGTNRQTYLGLSSGMGTVRVGYQYTNIYELGTLSGYAMGSEGVPGADKAHLHGQAQNGGTRANGITYISPSLSGVTVRVQYGAGSPNRAIFDSTAALAASGLSVDKNIRTSIMAKYDQGPLSLAIAYTQNEVTQSARATAFVATGVYGASLPATSTAITNAAARTANLTQIGGSYDLKVAKVGFTYNTGENGGAAVASAPQLDTDNTTYKAYNVSATFPMGALVPFVSFGNATSTNARTNVKTEDYSMTQFGARYIMSKRTTAYVMSGTTKNDAAPYLTTIAATTTHWKKDTKNVVGIAHSF